MHVSVWSVPVADLPALPPELHGAVRVLRLGRRAFVGTAWVDYRPGGDLSYRELLSAVLVRAGWRPRVTITHIWVDSVASRDGGRELWGIPKDLAELHLPGAGTASTVTSSGSESAVTSSGSESAATRSGTESAVTSSGTASAVTSSGTASAATAAGPIASAVLPRGDGLPPRLPVGFRVVQALDGRPCTTVVRSRARYGPAKLAWTIAPDGPLRFLAGRRPLLSFVAGDFRMRFGSATQRVVA
jgi:hypothetical protein